MYKKIIYKINNIYNSKIKRNYHIFRLLTVACSQFIRNRSKRIISSSDPPQRSGVTENRQL